MSDIFTTKPSIAAMSDPVSPQYTLIAPTSNRVGMNVKKVCDFPHR
jgi:hypothetical protein